MLFRPLAFAATAAALAIVPAIPISDADADKLFSALPVEVPPQAQGLPESIRSRNISVPCAACKGTNNAHLDLHLDVTPDNTLTLNGFEILPHADPRNGELMADLVQDGRDTEHKPLGYSLAVEQLAADDYQQMTLVGVELKIIQVEEQFVEGMPIIKAQIIKLVTGDLFIESIELKESTRVQCTSILCYAKEMAEKMFKALGDAKGCIMGQRHRGHHHHHGHEADVAKPAHETAVPAHGERPDQPAHGHRHNWRLLLANIASHIFLPVLMGVTAGVGVAVFAMVLCSVVIRFHQFVKGRRARRAGCCRKAKKHAARQQNSDVEKVSLIEALESEQPPQYQDDDDASKN